MSFGGCCWLVGVFDLNHNQYSQMINAFDYNVLEILLWGTGHRYKITILNDSQ